MEFLILISVIWHGAWVVIQKTRAINYLLQRLKVKDVCILCVTTWVTFAILLAWLPVGMPTIKEVIRHFAESFFVGSLTNILWLVTKKDENRIHF